MFVLDHDFENQGKMAFRGKCMGKVRMFRKCQKFWHFFLIERMQGDILGRKCHWPYNFLTKFSIILNF